MELKREFLLSFIHTDRQPKTDSIEDEIELNEEDMGIDYLSGDRLNLSDALQEQVILALPFAAVCSEDCKGICSGCGVNLNTSDCACVQKASHPAFDVLSQLKK